MEKLTNFASVNRLLAKYKPTIGANMAYNLDRMWQLMDFLGNPQDKLKVIHVAGTSGKTSTSYYIASMLQAAGFSVGLTVSPHISEVNERVQINQTPLPEAEFCQQLGLFVDHIEKSSIKPTYFELLIAFAYQQFVRLGVDYAVIEVGLGGLLDGTNVVTRPDKVCVITDIGLDHLSVLGNTLPEIATQKAGIIQKGNEVFCHQQTDEVMQVFQKRVTKQGAKLHILRPKPIAEILSSLPLFQQRNAQLALAVAEYVLKRDKHAQLTESQVHQSVATVIPGRMEIVRTGDKTIILDGAHNAQKLHALVTSLQAKFPDQRMAALVSFTASREQQLEGALAELQPVVSTVLATTFHGVQDLPHQAVSPDAIVQTCQQLGFKSAEAVENSTKALAVLCRQSEPILLITGSFYLLAELRPLILKA